MTQAPIDELFARVYDTLRVRAHHELARHSDRTLDTTALVHEAYLKIAGTPGQVVGDRLHFFRLAGRAMRQILIDHARRRHSEKRGGDVAWTTLGEGEALPCNSAMLIALEKALSNLGEAEPRLVEVVDLRFFAGLSAEETARNLGVTERTIVRDWRRARAYLLAAVDGSIAP